MIHTIGDSHAKIPWEKIPGVKVNHLGPILAFSVGRDALRRVNISNIGAKSNDWIIFCFGEIDCRGHIHKHITLENTYQKQIDSIVKKYFDTIKLNKNLIEFDINIAVCNVVPAYPYDKNEGFEYGRLQNKSILTNLPKEFFFVGTDAQRKLYVEYFNRKLKDYCLKNNYLFINVHDKYADGEGFLNKSLSDGNVHIGNLTYLIQFLKDNKLIT